MEIAMKTDSPVVDIHVGWRLAVGDFRDECLKTVTAQPFLHVGRPAHGEHDNAITSRVQMFEEIPGSWAWWMEVIGAAPAIELVQDAVEINTDD